MLQQSSVRVQVCPRKQRLCTCTYRSNLVSYSFSYKISHTSSHLFPQPLSYLLSYTSDTRTKPLSYDPAKQSKEL